MRNGKYRRWPKRDPIKNCFLPSKDGRRRNANLLYAILPIQGAVESYYRRQGLRT